MKTALFILILCSAPLSYSALEGDSSLNQGWSFSKGRSYKNTKSVSLKEAYKVFTEQEGFQEVWKKIALYSNNLDSKQATRFLVQCAKRPEWYFQAAALKNLERLDPDSARAQARRLLSKSAALVVRSSAVRVLSRVGKKEDVSVLKAAIFDKKNFSGKKSLWIRSEIAESILSLSHGQDQEFWEGLHGDSDPQVRKTALKTRVSY